jgi:hypothetical protein
MVGAIWQNIMYNRVAKKYTNFMICVSSPADQTEILQEGLSFLANDE